MPLFAFWHRPGKHYLLLGAKINGSGSALVKFVLFCWMFRCTSAAEQSENLLFAQVTRWKGWLCQYRPGHELQDRAASNLTFIPGLDKGLSLSSLQNRSRSHPAPVLRYRGRFPVGNAASYSSVSVAMVKNEWNYSCTLLHVPSWLTNGQTHVCVTKYLVVVLTRGR
jgi:hypothetical protein